MAAAPAVAGLPAQPTPTGRPATKNNLTLSANYQTNSSKQGDHRTRARDKTDKAP